MSRKDRNDIVEIEIYDQRYPLRLSTEAERKDILKLAEEVDLRMREISSQTGIVDSLKLAILTALHLAQDGHEQGRAGTEHLEAAISTGAEKWIAEIERVL